MTSVAEDVEQLEATIGRAAREIRSGAGITLDQLATRAREHGLRWSTARVIEFEKGQLRITLPMMLAVAQSLAQLAGREVAMTDLIPQGRGWVQITEDWLTPRERLREALAGAPLSLPQVVKLDEVPAGTQILVVGETEPRTLGPSPEVPDDPLVPTLAEERAARRIGVRPRQVAMWSNMLWRTHLDTEVARRAGTDATPQARGHITRQLVQEISDHIEAHRTQEASDGNS